MDSDADEFYDAQPDASPQNGDYFYATNSNEQDEAGNKMISFEEEEEKQEERTTQNEKVEAETEPRSDDLSESESTTDAFDSLIAQARDAKSNCDYKQALHFFNQALAITPNERSLQQKIARLQVLVDGLDSNDGFYLNEKTNYAELAGGFILPMDQFKKLFPHQRQGVRWLWTLHQANGGGILGDDMGLGKTIQIITFLQGLFTVGQAKSILIVMPKVVLDNWNNEFKKWFPAMKVKIFHGATSTRLRDLKSIQSKGGVCLTTYGMVRSNDAVLSQDGNFTWSYIILDEGHLIKNPACQVTKSLQRVPTEHKIILSGTPVQNNLGEMWALFDYVTSGMLLGPHRVFKASYEDPIVRGSDREASPRERQLANSLAQKLRETIAPHFLRREKRAVFGLDSPLPTTTKDALPTSADHDEQTTSNDTEKEANMHQLPHKKELVIWTILQPIQLELYKAFLETSEVAQVLNKSRSPLAALGVLKKISSHPYLLNASMKTLRGMMMTQSTNIALPKALREALQEELTSDNQGNEEEEEAEEEQENTKENKKKTAKSQQKTAKDMRLDLNLLHPHEIEELIAQSGKLIFVKALLPVLVSQKHRVLIFSQSLKMLDLLQVIITSLKLTFLRIDGTIVDRSERQRRIDTFQQDESVNCFILTTEVGGIGLNLTAADRVIVLEPSWNPSKDAQAIDRAYRMGQTKDVVVYRLNTCGTVEEKIFRKQIFKAYLMKTATTTNPGQNLRYFTQHELKALFSLDNPFESATHQQLMAVHNRGVICENFDGLQDHIDFLMANTGIFGISDHDLLYSKREKNTDANDPEIEEMANRLAQMLDLGSDVPKTPRRRTKQASTAQQTPKTGQTNKKRGATKQVTRIDSSSDSNNSDEEQKPKETKKKIALIDDHAKEDNEGDEYENKVPVQKRLNRLVRKVSEIDEEIDMNQANKSVTKPVVISLDGEDDCNNGNDAQPSSELHLAAKPCEECCSDVQKQIAYNSSIKAFNEQIAQDRLLEGVNNLLDALDVCDHLPALHQHAIQLGTQLQWL